MPKPSISDSISAPRAAAKPRSLHRATMCTWGMDMATQQATPAVHSKPSSSAGRQAEVARHARRGSPRRGRRKRRRVAAQHQRQRQHGRDAEDAYADVGLAPAGGVEEILHHWRPECAAEVVAACADRHRDAAAAVEPERGVGDQRRECRRAAEKADQHALRQRELPQAAGESRGDEAQSHAAGTDEDRDDDAEPVGKPAHEDAAEAEADHGERVGEGRVRASHAELRLHRRQRHGHGIHARAADGHQRERGSEPQPGVAGFRFGAHGG